MAGVCSPDQHALASLVIRADVTHHPRAGGHSLRKNGGIRALVVDIQDGRSPEDMGKKRGRRTGDLLVPSAPDGRNRLSPILLLGPAKLFSHET